MNMIDKVFKVFSETAMGRLGSLIMSLSVMLSCWFLNQAWNRINDMDKAIRELQVETASIKETRITSSQFNTIKAALDSSDAALDRRIIRLEESIPMIKENLTEIKTMLKSK